MNLYFLNKNPVLSASELSFLDPRGLNIYIREAFQLIFDAVGNPHGGLVPYNPNHPLVEWLRETPDNMFWASGYLGHLLTVFESLEGFKHELEGMYELLVDAVSISTGSWLFFKKGLTEISVDKLPNALSGRSAEEAYKRYLLRKRELREGLRVC